MGLERSMLSHYQNSKLKNNMQKIKSLFNWWNSLEAFEKGGIIIPILFVVSLVSVLTGQIAVGIGFCIVTVVQSIMVRFSIIEYILSLQKNVSIKLDAEKIAELIIEEIKKK